MLEAVKKLFVKVETHDAGSLSLYLGNIRTAELRIVEREEDANIFIDMVGGKDLYLPASKNKHLIEFFQLDKSVQEIISTDFKLSEKNRILKLIADLRYKAVNFQAEEKGTVLSWLKTAYTIAEKGLEI